MYLIVKKETNKQTKNNVKSMIEKRFLDSKIEVKDRTITGYGIVFNSESRLLYNQKDGKYFKEIVLPSSINEQLLRKFDILCLFNHNNNDILGRSKFGTGTLMLDVDKKGVKYTFVSPNTTIGNNLLESVKRGDITGSSFSFQIDECDYEKKNNEYYRYIKSFKLIYDISPVITPAYEQTSVDVRSIEHNINKIESYSPEKLNKYYKKYIDMLDELKNKKF